MKHSTTARLVPLLAVAFLLGPGTVRAHADTPHGTGAGPVVKEQKPWGIAGDARAAARTVQVGMSDTMRFTPERFAVTLGETVRFVVRNDGKLMHEFVIGTREELDRHAALMKKHPNMAHDEPYMAHVAPGKSGEIVWTFNRSGEFDFACLIAGHYEAGMIGRIRVSGAAQDGQSGSMAPAASARPAEGPMARQAAVTAGSDAPAVDGETVDGEVRRINKDGGRITLKHGEIKSADMPAMTMVFPVQDKALLDRVQVGDKVRFRVVNRSGDLIVTQIEALR